MYPIHATLEKLEIAANESRYEVSSMRLADSIDLQLERQEVVSQDVGFELSSNSESGNIPISVDGELGAVEIENLNNSFSMSDVTATHPNSQMTNEKYYSNDERWEGPDIVLINVSNTRIAIRSVRSVVLCDAMTPGAQIWSKDGVGGGVCFSECGDLFAYQPTFLGTTAVIIDIL
jgi:hypothetical protein